MLHLLLYNYKLITIDNAKLQNQLLLKVHNIISTSTMSLDFLFSGGQNGSDGLSGNFAPVPADISSLIDKYVLKHFTFIFTPAY